MSDPEVVRILREQKLALLMEEQNQMEEMARRWLRTEQAMEANMMALALEIKAMRDQGQEVSLWKIAKMERYQKLLDQARTEINHYTNYADDLITKRQGEMATAGIRTAREAIRASYEGSGIVMGRFNELPVRAVEAMIGMAGDGSPLKRLLEKSYGDAVDGLTKNLIDAITLGKSPRDTARWMREGFGMGLDQALNTARTEQLRAYRESNRMQYQESGLVRGYKRLTTHDDQTCAGCLFSEGEFFEVEEAFEEHPSGRCTLIPVVEGLPEVEFQNGMDWFMEQDEGTQENIMGSNYFGAWQDGKFELGDLVKHTTDEVWGGAYVPTPLGELLEE